MNPRRLAIALLSLAAGACQPAAKPDQPTAYEVRLAVSPAPGGDLQRLKLPAAALAAIRREDRGDVRIFDASGRPLPIAIAPSPFARSETPVPVFPVTGDLRAAGGGEVRLTLGPDRTARIESGGGMADGTGVVAALLDTRKVKSPVRALALDADWPAGRLVTVRVARSKDLAHWEPLGERTVFGSARGTPLGGDTIDLGGAPLEDGFLRITWSGNEPLAIRSARIIGAEAAGDPPMAQRAGSTVLAGTHEARFALPHASALTAIVLEPASSDGVLPVRVFGRTDREAPWQPLGAEILRGDDSRANRVPLQASPSREFRIVADARTAGFDKAPRLSVEFATVTILVRFNGNPPYRLAAGNAEARGAYLTRDELAPGTDVSRLREAAAENPPVNFEVGDAGLEIDRRKVGLWAILLLATTALALAVVSLLRRP